MTGITLADEYLDQSRYERPKGFYVLTAVKLEKNYSFLVHRKWMDM